MPLITNAIVMWSGTLQNIPNGWQLCDGTNGTPDLRNRFVVGAGNNYAVGITGGNADAVLIEHTHTGSTNSAGNHSHSFNLKSVNSSGGNQQTQFVPNGADGTDANATITTSSNGNHSHTFTTANSGSSATNANLPPYYALAFIKQTV